MSSSYSYLGFFLVADVVVVVPLAFDQLIRQHISLFNSDNETRSFDIFSLGVCMEPVSVPIPRYR
jgi:hypothetical protein